jgi:hypothetical protein
VKETFPVRFTVCKYFEILSLDSVFCNYGKAKKDKFPNTLTNCLGEMEEMFSAKEFIEKALEEIRKSVGESRVISACSGGVDSSNSLSGS